MGESYFTLFFKVQSTVVYLLYNLLYSHAKQSEVKQSEKENVAQRAVI